MSIRLSSPDATCKVVCRKPPQPSLPAALSGSPGKSCSTALTGQWEYPHLIIKVDSNDQDTSYGTQYNGTVTPTISSIFNFDIPSTAKGKTCSLIFLFPDHSRLVTSTYDITGDGIIDFQQLSAPALESTTYANQPGPSQGFKPRQLTLAPNHAYNVANTVPCPAGQRVAYKMSSPSGTSFSWFQDYNPSP